LVAQKHQEFPAMIRILLALAVSLLPNLASAQTGETAPEKYRVYFGTYSGKVSKGIYQCELDLKTGAMTKPTLAAETKDPSFLAFHPNKKFLYAANEGPANISAFAIDPKTGELTFLNSQPSGGGAPCHLMVDPTGKNVLAANYTGGSCVCLPIEADGKLAKASAFDQHKGAAKQVPHGHSIHVDRANKFAFCADLGLDKVLVYRFDPAKGSLTPNDPPAFDTPPGSGPRHFAWGLDGKSAYINGETNMTIIACDYDAEKGVLTKKQVLSTLPEGANRKGTSTAETVVHPSGKFVYVSNRGHNSIAIFSIDATTRELKAVGHEARGIATPRNFAIEPTGQLMLVANQSGGNVISFRINPATGELTPTGVAVEVESPVCVRFMPLEK
jgi:6-phosphogluconolactonase